MCRLVSLALKKISNILTFFVLALNLRRIALTCQGPRSNFEIGGGGHH